VEGGREKLFWGAGLVGDYGKRACLAGRRGGQNMEVPVWDGFWGKTWRWKEAEREG
jgi:hypothetical protein